MRVWNVATGKVRRHKPRLPLRRRRGQERELTSANAALKLKETELSGSNANTMRNGDLS